MLIISYLLIVAVLLYATFKSRLKLPLWFDIICIAVVVWFGIALWYAPSHYRGWPVKQYPVNGTYVKDYMVVEPNNKGNKGAIYIFGVNFQTQDDRNIIDPRDLLTPDIKLGTPRLFEIPYSKDKQKKLQKKRNKGDMIFWMGKGKDKRGRGKDGKDNKDTSGFKIINMQQILTKGESDE